MIQNLEVFKVIKESENSVKEMLRKVRMHFRAWKMVVRFVLSLGTSCGKSIEK